MLPWKLRKRQLLPVNQNLSSVYFSLAKFQLVNWNLSLAMIWQMTCTHKLPKLCSATLTYVIFSFVEVWKYRFSKRVFVHSIHCGFHFECNQSHSCKQEQTGWKHAWRKTDDSWWNPETCSFAQQCSGVQITPGGAV